MSGLTDHFFLHLYQATSRPPTNQPQLQILGFETSEQDSNEITIRLSDGHNFLDCLLVGPYQIDQGRLIASASGFAANGQTGNHFQKHDVVLVADYFYRMEESKICQLMIIARKLVLINKIGHKVGHPREIAQWILALKEEEQTSKAGIVVGQKKCNSTEEILCQEEEPKLRKGPGKTVAPSVQIFHRDPEMPLRSKEVLMGYEGFFIGRLIRMRSFEKEGVESVTSFLYLAFVDELNDLTRVTILGKMAMKEERLLIKNRVYYIKGLEVITGKDSNFIRLRDSEYRLHEITNEEITAKFPSQHYHWEHQSTDIQNENVDVIGRIDDIEQKADYGEVDRKRKEVIRIILRNAHKTVKISFWASQMKSLQHLNLKRGQLVIIEDVRKKKNIFLDFSFQSNLVHLEQHPKLLQRFQSLLPSNDDTPEPNNILQVQKAVKSNCTRSYTITACLAKINLDKFILKVCELCKKKVKLSSQKCYECNNNVLAHKYNTSIEVQDASGGMVIFVFDNIAQKLFGMNADECQIVRSTPKFEEILDALLYMDYSVTVEYKNQRLLLRSIERVGEEKEAELTRRKVQQIKQVMGFP